MTHNTYHNTNSKTTKSRRWFRFRLRTLLILVTVVSFPLGWVGWELDQRRRENEVVAWVEEMGGVVHFYSYIEKSGLILDARSRWEKKKDNWFGERVRIVVLDDTKVSDLSLLADLKNLDVLGLASTRVSDLSPLAELKNLKRLWLSDSLVSEEQVQELRLALPNCEIEIESND